MLLWRTLRAVHAWATTAPADRSLVFPPDARDRRMADLLSAAPDPALERPLLVLSELLDGSSRIDGERVALACLCVAGWARGAGKPATADEFTYAAALVCPGNPAHALAAARASRDRGEVEEAEAMYHRAVGLARQVHDWDSYVRAHAGLGKLAQARGRYPSARRALLRALRNAERHHRRGLRAMVLHDLFTVARESGMGEAEGYAQAAAETYGAGHASLAALAGDVAILWMDQGRFAEAATVLRWMLPHLSGEARMVALGNSARAAGGAGDYEGFRRAFDEVLAAPEGMPRRLDALNAAVLGAVGVGVLDLAEAGARSVLAGAEQRGQHGTVAQMEGLLAEVEGLRRTATRCPVQAARTDGEGSPLLRTLERVLAPAGAGA